jgi:DNA-binding response OmpR family regulator
MKKTNAKLMVVDNEIDICNFVKSFFEARGFLVATALNGDDAMSKLLAEKPDVVILDVMMRRPNEGLEYLPQIKEKLPSAKVLMVTGVDDDESIKSAKAMGADDYITKPLILEYLESTVLTKVKNLKKAAA